MNPTDLIRGNGLVLGSILLLIMVIGLLAWRIDILGEKLEGCKTEKKAIQLLMDSNKADFERNLKYYGKAVDDTARFYDEQLDQIKQFKGESNETTCHSARRLFDRFEY